MRCAFVSIPEHDVVATPDGRFAYLSEGDESAPLALCLHGFPDHPLSFRPLMTLLAKAGYRAVAPWMRGYAPSIPEGPFHVERLAQDTVALARALSPDRPTVLIGHDWGAIASYGALAASPETFAAAVTMAVPHPLSFLGNLRRQPDQLRRSWYMLFFQLPRLPEYVIPREDFAFIDRLWKAWSPGYSPDPEDMAELKQCLTASMPAPINYYRAMFRPLRESADRMKRTQHQRISTPTLNLQGADDGCISPRIGDGQERFFDGRFRSAVISGAGHFLQLEAPDAVGDAVLSWLQEHAG